MERRHPFTKVPEITIFFWIVKILTTAFGESTSDFLVNTIDPYVAVSIGAVCFLVAMVFQFKTRRYNPWIYWFAVTMVAIFGTMAADAVHIGLGVPYIVSTAAFALALVIIFFLWWNVEKDLSIHSIYTVRREVFYWLTVVATFALGTAAGDLSASTFGLGYLGSGVLFAVVLLFVACVHFVFTSALSMEHHRESRNAVLAFWICYVLTRPLGASFADWFGKSPSIGGLGWGDAMVSAILAGLIILLVAFLAFTRIDQGKRSR